MQIREEIKKALIECGYDTLTDMQKAVIEASETSNALYVQAETGSGKTISFLIPALQCVQENDSNTYTLIIEPTRELAVQTGLEAVKLASYTRIHCVTCIGGMDIDKQIYALKHHPHIIIGTPGRILDLLDRNVLHIDALRMCVIDEADMVYSTGQLKETLQILNHIPSETQMLFLSATAGDSIQTLIPAQTQYLLFHEETVAERISTFYIKTHDKTETLLSLLKHLPVTRAIVFVNYRDLAEKLQKVLEQNDILCSAFSGLFSEQRRLSILNDFRKGSIRVLIATDAAARGLDIPDVSHSIAYDLPVDTSTWIHRSGRSAHQGGSGVSISLLNTDDCNEEVGMYILRTSTLLEYSQQTTYALNTPLAFTGENKPHTQTLIMWAGRKDKIRAKDIVGALCTIMPFEEIGTIEIQDRYSLITIKNDHKDVIARLNKINVKGKPRHFALQKTQ